MYWGWNAIGEADFSSSPSFPPSCPPFLPPSCHTFCCPPSFPPSLPVLSFPPSLTPSLLLSVGRGPSFPPSLPLASPLSRPRLPPPTTLGKLLSRLCSLPPSFLPFFPPSLPFAGNWVRLSLLVKKGGNYTLSLFGSSNSGGTLTLTVDDYLQKGKAVVSGRNEEMTRGREGGTEGRLIWCIFSLNALSHFFLGCFLPLLLSSLSSRLPQPPFPPLTGTINGPFFPTSPSFLPSPPAWASWR